MVKPKIEYEIEYLSYGSSPVSWRRYCGTTAKTWKKTLEREKKKNPRMTLRAVKTVSMETIKTFLSQ